MKQLDALIAELQDQLSAAYKKGFADGMEEMRRRILQVTQLPQNVTSPQTSISSMFAPEYETPPAQASFARSGDNSSRRAPRGSVGRMINRILADHNAGLFIAEVEGLAPKYDTDVAIKSIGNELRRFEGERYRRDERGKWFLISGNAEKETAGMP